MPYDERDDELDKEIARLQDEASPPPKCASCGSDKIIPTAVLAPHERLAVSVPAEPSAMIFKGWESDELAVRVCGACGYTQFFVKNPARLYAVYQQSLRIEES